MHPSIYEYLTMYISTLSTYTENK